MVNTFLGIVLVLSMGCASATAAPARLIECTAGETTQLVLEDDKVLTIVIKGERPEKLLVRSKIVEGRGEKARDVYSFGDQGTFSFHDTYGSLSKVVADLKKWPNLKEIVCKRN